MLLWYNNFFYTGINIFNYTRDILRGLVTLNMCKDSRITLCIMLLHHTKYVFRLYTSYWHDKFGTINGLEAFQKSKEFIDSYNSKVGAKVAPTKQLENGSVVVCVVDEFMKRVKSGQIMLVDATGSLDRFKSPTFEAHD